MILTAEIRVLNAYNLKHTNSIAFNFILSKFSTLVTTIYLNPFKPCHPTWLNF
jgi:hypothetical protein